MGIFPFTRTFTRKKGKESFVDYLQASRKTAAPKQKRSVLPFAHAPLLRCFVNTSIKGL